METFAGREVDAPAFIAETTYEASTPAIVKPYAAYRWKEQPRSKADRQMGLRDPAQPKLSSRRAAIHFRLGGETFQFTHKVRRRGDSSRHRHLD
ncbi:hypothetical protein EAS62_40045 [Bradyrhizobium zhanjiangense]|uniref:Uncharacterized protein n=1 Tax=Bradyrhizobium zhanjiangense TaxID=1325107 RepID=A0ABY0D877_9BRAD|nr:hypothetical protein EAS62_40045 [Bradyrhizobium zhanjiangense]